MHLGKTLFAQLMDFLPWTTFTRIVNRYNGDHKRIDLRLNRRMFAVAGLEGFAVLSG
tara:strand:- start:83 stop:253 length:171 start_codon:yes stop_codon:yes gene_type:complete